MKYFALLFAMIASLSSASEEPNKKMRIRYTPDELKRLNSGYDKYMQKKLQRLIEEANREAQSEVVDDSDMQIIDPLRRKLECFAQYAMGQQGDKANEPTGSSQLADMEH